MEISAKLVKELRDKTNSGMMDCKKALAECEGNLEKAVDWLRQKGLMTARKREGRSTKEGLVICGLSGNAQKAVMVELNCETDFVAKNEGFQKVARNIVDQLLAADPAPTAVADVLALPGGDGLTIGQSVTTLVGTIGEAINLRRVEVCRSADGFLHSYIHGAGRLGVLVEMTAEKMGPAAEALAHDLAMHIAAANPAALTAAAIPADMLEREKGVFRAKVAESGKPENMWDKIVEGQLKKFYTEVALLEQAFVKDPGQNIAAVLKAAAADCGRVEIKGYVRFQLGEELPGESSAGDE